MILDKYFDIRELVDKQTFERFGEKAWMFFDPRLLETILFIREALDKPITANNWSFGGNLSQRGLRTNLSPLVRNKRGLYLSAHRQGMALDFDVQGMKAYEVRDWLEENEEALPHKIRLERKLNGKEIGWSHVDVYDYKDNPKVYLFDV